MSPRLDRTNGLGVIGGDVAHAETTDFKGDVYADPSRTLYHTLGLVNSFDRTPAGQEKRSYLSKSFVGNLVRSLWVRLFT